MLIKNLTNHKTIVQNAEILENTFSKFIGLMFSRKKNRALIFKFSKEKIISLHMFFVFYPIDVVFLDKNQFVVDNEGYFMPFRLYKSKKKAMYAIELPAGIIKKCKIKTGDRIKFY